MEENQSRTRLLPAAFRWGAALVASALAIGCDGVPTDAPVVGLRNPVPILALCNVVKHALHHDPGTFERGLTVTDFRIGNNVFS